MLAAPAVAVTAVVVVASVAARTELEAVQEEIGAVAPLEERAAAAPAAWLFAWAPAD